MKILIVDDNDDIRRMLRLQLSCIPDIDFSEACDGLEALRLAESVRPDMIVLDLEMPVMTGNEALPRLRSQHPAAAIIVHTATPRSLAPTDLVDAADGYVEKGGDIITCVRQLRPGPHLPTTAGPAGLSNPSAT